MKEPLKNSGERTLKALRSLAHMGGTNVKRLYSEFQFAVLLRDSADFTGLTAVHAIRANGGVGGPLRDEGPSIPIA